jgi:hypothetical protein
MAIPRGNQWINQIFKAKAATRGGTLRRKIASVEKYATVEQLQEEVLNRGFHLIRVGHRRNGQLVILCNPGNIKVLC